MGNLDTIWKELKHNKLNEEQLDEETSFTVYKTPEGKRVPKKTVIRAVSLELGCSDAKAEEKISRGLLSKSDIQKIVDEYYDYHVGKFDEESRDDKEELVKVLVKVNGKWETLYESIPESKADAIWKAVFAAGENLISIENEAGRRVEEFNKKQMGKKED